MAATTESLNIQIKAKDLYSSELKKMQRSFKVAGAAIAGSLALAGGLLLKVAEETAALGDQFQKMSIRTGVATQTLSEMAHVAQIAGTDIQTVEKAIIRMTKVANDSQAGLSTATRTLDQLGVKAENTNGTLKGTEQLFFETIEALRGVENQTKRTALAQEVFGKSGVKLLTIVNESKDGIAELRKEARDLGITFDQEAANQAARFNDEMLRLKQSAKGLSFTIGKELIPVLADAATFLQRASKNFKDFIGVGLGLDQITDRILNESFAISKLEKAQENLHALNFIGRGDIQKEINSRTAKLDILKKERKAIIENSKAQETSGAGPSGSIATGTTQEDANRALSFEAQLKVDLRNLELNAIEINKEIRQTALDEEIADIQSGIQEQLNLEISRNEAIGTKALELNAIREEIRKRDLAAEKAAVERKKQMNKDALTNSVSFFESLNTIADGKNRALFNAMKLARASEAIVNAYAGANQAMASLPYPYNLVAAGSVIAAGLKNLSVIQRTQFGGAATSGATTSTPITPITQLPEAAGISTSTEQAPPNISIEINGVLNADDVAQLVEDELIPAFNVALDRNSASLNVRA